VVSLRGKARTRSHKNPAPRPCLCNPKVSRLDYSRPQRFRCPPVASRRRRPTDTSIRLEWQRVYAKALFTFIILVARSSRDRHLSGIYCLSRNAILLTGPFIEINQLATLGTERPPRIILPFGRPAARWTFRHTEKVRRNKGNVKRCACSWLVIHLSRKREFGSILTLSQYFFG
jgi:hypothetical protein